MARPALGSLSANDRGWKTGKAFYRYVLIGILTNACGYGLYLLVTWLGGSPKISMTVLYWLATLLGFLGNRYWAFKHQGKVLPSLIRYGFAYLIGYGIDFYVLYVFVDRLGYPHQLVQAVAAVVVAGALFLMLNLFVFPQKGRRVRT